MKFDIFISFRVVNFLGKSITPTENVSFHFLAMFAGVDVLNECNYDQKERYEENLPLSEIQVGVKI